MQKNAYNAAQRSTAASRGQAHSLTLKLAEVPLWLPDQARQLLDGLIRQTLHLALTYTAGVVSDEAPVDSGALGQSFTADPANQIGGIEILGAAPELEGRVFSSLPYAIVMEEGRRPGQPIGRAGIDAIGLWAQRKLGLSADEASRAKWAIAQGIVRSGIAGKHYAERAANSARPRVEQMFKILGDQIAQQMTVPASGTGGAA